MKKSLFRPSLIPLKAFSDFRVRQTLYSEQIKFAKLLFYLKNSYRSVLQEHSDNFFETYLRQIHSLLYL